MKHICMLFAALLLGGCLNGSPAVKQNTPFEQTRWEVVEIGGNDVTLSQHAFITFSDGNETRASGFAGCNRFGGSFTKKAEQLTFGPLMATRRYCPAMPEEDALFKALERVERFSIAGNTLTLYGKNGILLRLEAHTPTR